MLDKVWFNEPNTSRLYELISGGNLLRADERDELMKLSLPLCGRLVDKYINLFHPSFCLVIRGSGESGMSDLAEISHPIASSNVEVRFFEDLDNTTAKHPIETIKVSPNSSETFASFEKYLSSDSLQKFLVLESEKETSSCDLLKMLAAIRLSLPASVFVGVSRVETDEKMFHLSTSYGANFLGIHELEDLLANDLLMDAKWSFLSGVTALNIRDTV